MGANVVFVDLIIVIAYALLGIGVLRSLRQDVTLLSFLSLGVPLGGFVFAFVFFVLASIGLPITLPTALAVMAVLFTLFLILGRREAVREEREPVSEGRFSRFSMTPDSILFAAAILLAFLAAIVLSVGLSYHSWDAIATWALGSYGMVFRRSILGAAEFGNGLMQYPMNIQFQISLFRLFDGDVLPGSKLLFPAYYLALLTGVYQFLVFWNVRKWLARIGTLLLATTPIIFNHAYIGYTNIAFTVYYVLGVFWLIRGIQQQQHRTALLGSVLLAAGLWTRPEGTVLAILPFIVFLVLPTQEDQRFRSLLLYLAPLLVVFAGWKLLLPEIQESWNVSPPIDFTRDALQGLLRGEIHWNAFVIVFRFIAGQVLRYRDFGILALLTVASMLVSFSWSQVRNTRWLQHFWAITILAGIAILGAHYIGAYQPGGDDFLYQWMSLEFTRVALPVLLFLFVLSQISLSETLSVLFPDRPIPVERSPEI